MAVPDRSVAVKTLGREELNMRHQDLAALALIAGLAVAAQSGIGQSTNENRSNHPMVIIKTSLGDIKAELFDDKAPATVKNFLCYVDAGHYNGTIFHRVIDNFMIQGGGFTPDMQQKPTRAPIKNEAANKAPNKRGTLAMARTSDINSAGAQFFINVKDNAFLNYRDDSVQGFGYCVFGNVIEGMDVVDKIKAVKTGQKGQFSDVPLESVMIKEIIRVEK
jgi:peptidyl-prolyl cis-trans isomerase B (cyclophilin B)